MNKRILLRVATKILVYFSAVCTGFFAGYGMESFCQDFIDSKFS